MKATTDDLEMNDHGCVPIKQKQAEHCSLLATDPGPNILKGRTYLVSPPLLYFKDHWAESKEPYQLVFLKH